MNFPHTYSSNPLDRGYRERRDERWITDAAKDPTSRFLPVKDMDVLISQEPQDSLGWLGHDDILRLGDDTRAIFLGLRERVAYFAMDISGHENLAKELTGGGGYGFVDARTVTEFLSRADSGIVAQALAQVSWHNRTGFCSICGNSTFVRQGGQVRKCSKCEAEHHPRTDPVVISVVSDHDWCLLGQSRGRLSSTKRFSALAGFVEQGETVEEAVAREVMEEAGIGVTNVRYHSSQPWPFPYSLMIGCHADAATTDISIDDGEMVDVRWFHRDEVLRALEGTSESLVVPGPITIAHHLIKAWATDGAR